MSLRVVLFDGFCVIARLKFRGTEVVIQSERDYRDSHIALAVLGSEHHEKHISFPVVLDCVILGPALELSSPKLLSLLVCLLFTFGLR